MANEMTITEQERRDALENELGDALEAGRRSYLTVGRCLAEILGSRLYRNEYESFESYCNDFWGFSESLARRWADAYRVAQNLTSDAEEMPILAWDALIGFQPSHAHVLKRLPDDLQVEAWTAAKAVSQTPTAALLETVVEKFQEEYGSIDGKTKEEELDFLQRIERDTSDIYIASKRVVWARMLVKKIHGLVRQYDERYGFAEDVSQLEMIAERLSSVTAPLAPSA